MRLVDLGRHERAGELCNDLLAAHPDDVNVLGLRGAILVKLNRFDDAEAVLRRTISLAPAFAKPYEDLGFVLHESGRHGEAVEMLKNAVRLDPSLELAWLHLGKSLTQLGNGPDADTAFERAFELNPEKGKLAHAAELHKDGNLDEAERLYREVIRSNPDNVDAMRLLGRVALSAKRNADAEALFRRATAIAPDFVGAIGDLGRVLRERDELEEAIECFRRMTELQPGNPQGHFLLAGALAQAALTYDAADAYEKVLALNPEHAGAMLGLGHTLKTVGRQEEAVNAYRECIRLKPDNGESFWSLANLKTYRLGDADIAAMQAALQRNDLNEQSRVNFLFAMAKAQEDCGDYDAAWEFYDQGNRVQRMLVSYDPVQTEVLNDAVKAVFDTDFLRRHAGDGNPSAAPIFVVGLPRSGSTLIEQILASHSRVEGTSELPYLGRVATSLNRNRADGVNYPEAVRELSAGHLVSLGQDYLDRCKRHRREGTQHFIDKMPNNFPTIGFLHSILPNATIIDARRHPLDSCLGCYRQLFARGQTFTYDLADIGEYFLEYERMMDHWHAVLPGTVLTVQYEELVRDLETGVRRLLEHCSLPFEDRCLRFHETDRPVRTASSEQVRQPIYTSAIGFWRNYEAHLGDLQEVLEPSLERYADYLPG